MSNAADQDEEIIATLPSHFTTSAILKDDLITPTSVLQDRTVQECLPLLNGINNPANDPLSYDERGVPDLSRPDHINFALDSLEQFPSRFVGIDASRPWMIYWSLVSLYMLGEHVDSLRARWAKG